MMIMSRTDREVAINIKGTVTVFSKLCQNIRLSISDVATSDQGLTSEALLKLLSLRAGI